MYYLSFSGYLYNKSYNFYLITFETNVEFLFGKIV